jgi:threonine aldolase
MNTATKSDPISNTHSRVPDIDLRSDTVTRPTEAMRRAMADAEVGDDVYGEDPTINRLEAMAAERLGQESALFVASGTQGNLIALLAHCARGDEYIAGQQAHCYRTEAGGASVLGGIQAQPIEMEPDGRLDLDRVRAAIKPNDFHYARTRVVCLENTHSGHALPMTYMQAARALTAEHGLAMHLDGARVFNAAVALGSSAEDIGRQFDSISFCLSKGLGAPAGGLLCASRALIDEARRLRKMLGGGMRQVGILGAAGIHVLEHHVDRLGEDHERAQRFFDLLGDIDEIELLGDGPATNMVFVRFDEADHGPLREYLANRGIVITTRNPARMVVHLDIGDRDIENTVAAIKSFFGRNADA